MSESALTIKPIDDDGHRWPSIMIYSEDNGFEDCSLDRTESAAESAIAG